MSYSTNSVTKSLLVNTDNRKHTLLFLKNKRASVPVSSLAQTDLKFERGAAFQFKGKGTKPVGRCVQKHAYVPIKGLNA